MLIFALMNELFALFADDVNHLQIMDPLIKSNNLFHKPGSIVVVKHTIFLKIKADYFEDNNLLHYHFLLVQNHCCCQRNHYHYCHYPLHE